MKKKNLGILFGYGFIFLILSVVLVVSAKNVFAESEEVALDDGGVILGCNLDSCTSDSCSCEQGACGCSSSTSSCSAAKGGCGCFAR